MFKTNLKRVIAVAVLSSMATFAFAEDAPVYDADNFPPQFDGQTDSDISSKSSSASPSSFQPVDNTSSSSGSSSLSMGQRLNRIEQQVNNMQSNASSSKINALQTEVQSLRGQVEQLTHQLQQVQSQQRTMYSDLDKRMSASGPSSTVGSAKPSEIQALRSQVTQLTQQIQQLQTQMHADKHVSNTKTLAAAKTPVAETPDDTISDNAVKPVVSPKTKVKTKTTTATAATESVSDVKKTPLTTTPVAAVGTEKAVDQPNVAEEQQIYQTAYDLIKAKKYNEAIAALQKMLKKYPSGQFAANAHYWLGELYGLLGKNDQSAVEFSTVVENYPDSPKVSDAQLKLGLIYAAQFKWPDAKSAFKRVINQYPGTASARLASEQLKQIKQAGH
jgi:tol-pal system protein YbgF